jgi:hypothetical protein
MSLEDRPKCTNSTLKCPRSRPSNTDVNLGTGVVYSGELIDLIKSFTKKTHELDESFIRAVEIGTKMLHAKICDDLRKRRGSKSRGRLGDNRFKATFQKLWVVHILKGLKKKCRKYPKQIVRRLLNIEMFFSWLHVKLEIIQLYGEIDCGMKELAKVLNLRQSLLTKSGDNTDDSSGEIDGITGEYFEKYQQLKDQFKGFDNNIEAKNFHYVQPIIHKEIEGDDNNQKKHANDPAFSMKPLITEDIIDILPEYENRVKQKNSGISHRHKEYTFKC